MASGLTYSIVRPTAYFKSLSGQVDRVRRGKPFLVFGDGRLTACKPISDDDLADYIAGCLDDPARHDRVLPIGGPGEAITPRQQGEHLFALLGRAPRFKQVPVALLDAIITGLSTGGRLVPALAAKAELARSGLRGAVARRPIGRFDGDGSIADDFDLLPDEVADALVTDLT
jgi:divinyl chlorophyllide a 8-vinyl-reductase